jgi:hypothetical protein
MHSEGPQNSCDIIDTCFQGSGEGNCYVFQPFKCLNYLRYPKHIAILAEFVLLARKHNVRKASFFSINITHKNLDLPWDILSYPQE